MISDLDRRILARATNTPWHELVSDKLGVLDHFTCSCGKEYVSKGAFLEHLIRCGVTFSTPDDWELVRVEVACNPAFVPWLWLQETWPLNKWIALSCDRKCQYAADFIKSRPDIFPWITEMLKEEV